MELLKFFSSKKGRDSKKKNHQSLLKNTDFFNKEDLPLFASLKTNFDMIKKIMGNSTDIMIKEFKIGEKSEINLGIIYTDGLSDKQLINEFVLETLMINIRQVDFDLNSLHHRLMDVIKTNTLPVAEITEVNNFNKLFLHVLSGDTILLIDGITEGISLSSREWAVRSIQEPESQTVVRGPRDGFTETLRTNTALIRRRIKDPNLWLETKQIGARTQTDVSIMFLQDVADKKTVDEVRERLKDIDTDIILDSGNIEEYIQDGKITTFPTVYDTERPDTVAAGILQGKIAILVDGSPFVLLVPALLINFFQTSEDYYQRADIATVVRLIRFLAFFLSLLTPSLFIAITTFHQEMLPTSLLINLSAQREGVPLSTLFEAILMELTFEILREASIRMPRSIGTAISIVGALVIGQAAVEAGFVSAAMVIIVSLTAICNFVSPSYSMAASVRILRFMFMFIANLLGLFGIIIGLLLLVLHLSSIRSFGEPYLTPLAPFKLKAQKDSIVRLPKWFLETTKRKK
ncbi:spore germination protein [Niallia circulans]|uniref:Spore germination protein n=1 Tax=Niallia circulans TaxID=1397 RepID=A0A553STG7_NIACI|nr:spore germination protein [Niallia circulans]TRZ40289.1 spore germination protein [Niallia circulans]